MSVNMFRRFITKAVENTGPEEAYKTLPYFAKTRYDVLANPSARLFVANFVNVIDPSLDRDSMMEWLGTYELILLQQKIVVPECAKRYMENVWIKDFGTERLIEMRTFRDVHNNLPQSHIQEEEAIFNDSIKS